MARLTLAEARSQLRGIGYSLKSRDGEFIVGPTGEREGSGTYYTNDLQDAVDTAWSLYHRRTGTKATRNPAHRSSSRESAGPESALTERVSGHGKFGGEVKAVEIAYDLINSGWSHEEVGGDDEGFPWSALVINVPFGRKLASFVLQQRSDGFVFGKVFTDSKQAERVWDGIAADYDRHVKESGMYDEDGELIDDDDDR